MQNHGYMLLLLLVTVVSTQPEPQLPEPVVLKQAAARPHPKVKLPNHGVGPKIPGLAQGAIPQGLVYWEKQDWFLISHYFEEKANTSVVTAVHAKTGKLERCLTLVEASGRPHTGHVGGLAVSDKYLWTGSGELYRAPLEAVEARPVQKRSQLTRTGRLAAFCLGKHLPQRAVDSDRRHAEGIGLVSSLPDS
jgi:hypothetical protein